MSKERMKEIEERISKGLGCLKHYRRKALESSDEGLIKQVKLLESDISYLIQRVYELEDEIETSEEVFMEELHDLRKRLEGHDDHIEFMWEQRKKKEKTLNQTITRLSQHNKEYRKELGFYADIKNWNEHRTEKDFGGFKITERNRPAHKDCGKRARQVLEELE